MHVRETNEKSTWKKSNEVKRKLGCYLRRISAWTNPQVCWICYPCFDPETAWNPTNLLVCTSAGGWTCKQLPNKSRNQLINQSTNQPSINLHQPNRGLSSIQAIGPIGTSQHQQSSFATRCGQNEMGKGNACDHWKDWLGVPWGSLGCLVACDQTLEWSWKMIQNTVERENRVRPNREPPLALMIIGDHGPGGYQPHCRLGSFPVI